MKQINAEKGAPYAISPEYVTRQIDRMADHDSVITINREICPTCGSHVLEEGGKREVIASNENTLPMAIGAALARPGRQIVAMCGDSDFASMTRYLSTIIRYNLPVKVILFNNRSMGMLRLLMEVAGRSDWEADLYNPDFGAIAEAMGMEGFSVHDPLKVDEILSRAFEANGPALVNIKTDSNVLARPVEARYCKTEGFALSLSRAAFTAHMNKVIKVVKESEPLHGVAVL